MITENRDTLDQKKKTHSDPKFLADMIANFYVTRIENQLKKQVRPDLIDQSVALYDDYHTDKRVGSFWDDEQLNQLTPFEHLLLDAKIDFQRNNKTPKEILEKRLQMILGRHDRRMEERGKISRFLGELISMKDITMLSRNTAQDIIESESLPNCIQIGTVYAEIFKHLGISTETIQYKPGKIPHIGIYFPNHDMSQNQGHDTQKDENKDVLMLDEEYSEHGSHFVLRSSSLEAISQLKINKKRSRH